MPHPKAKINPELGKRLKTICNETDTTQAELAERIYISQQTISKIINGKATLTLPTAKRIVEAFPQYRLEWLIGADDYSTTCEKESSEFIANMETELDLQKAVIRLAKTRNIIIHSEIKVESYTEDADGGFGFAGFGEEANDFTWKVKRGKSTIQLTHDDFHKLIDEIADFLEFKIGRLLKGGV